MPRYIDEESLMQKLSRMIDCCKKDNNAKGLTALFQVGDAIMDCPAADVVPRAEVERLQIEIQALKIANEKMYIANKASQAEVVKEIISIIEQRDEMNDKHACGVKNEICSALYRGKKDAYRDIKEILEQKYTEEK